jgi:hypothetical protein
MTSWTAADQAELDVLLHALTSGYAEHREHCASCAGPEPCPHLQRAIAEVVDWREARILLSRAQALRIDQELAA